MTMQPLEGTVRLGNQSLHEIDRPNEQTERNNEPRQGHAERPAEEAQPPQDTQALHHQHPNGGHERGGVMRVVINNDPEGNGRESRLNKQQAIAGLQQRPRQRKERDG